MVVIIFMGLPGTGKTTLALKLFNELKNAIYLSTDTIRKTIFSHFIELNIKDELYDMKNVDTVYNVINYLIEQIYNFYAYIIVDATFHLEKRRINLINKLNDLSQTYYLFNTVVNNEIIKKRMDERKNKTLESDALYAQYLKLKKEWEPIDSTKLNLNFYEIDTNNKIIDNLNTILTILGLN